MKIAIVIGHNSASQGAVRVTDKRSEYDWNGQLAELIRAHDPASVRVFKRTSAGGYSAEIDRVYAEVDAWGADCSIELHFNASGTASAAGGETLSSGSTKSLALANGVRAAVRAALGNKDRGVKVVSRTDRGGRSLWQGRAPAVLAEPYFGSNAGDCEAASKHMDELAEAYYRAAVAFLGGKPATAPASAPAAPPVATDDDKAAEARLIALVDALRLLADNHDPRV
jgi:N-acetylmuramoyl-L-alanine amidase